MLIAWEASKRSTNNTRRIRWAAKKRIFWGVRCCDGDSVVRHLGFVIFDRVFINNTHTYVHTHVHTHTYTCSHTRAHSDTFTHPLRWHSSVGKTGFRQPDVFLATGNKTYLASGVPDEGREALVSDRVALCNHSNHRIWKCTKIII